MAPTSHRILRPVQQVLFWLWVPAGVVLGGSLLAPHWATLPVPERDDSTLVAALAELRTADDANAWMAVHVLYAACTCSRRVVEHLTADARPSGISDKILLVGSTPEIEERLAASTLTVVRTTADELANRYAIEGAPMLVVVDPVGVVRYRGGYTERKQSLAIQDVDIITRVRTDAVVATLPLYGCAVSKQLRELLDPFGLRSAAQE